MPKRFRLICFFVFLYCVLIEGKRRKKLNFPPVDGQWSGWSLISEQGCSAPCGGGYQTRLRTCSNPRPQFGGKPCEGPDRDNVTCNTHSCQNMLEKSMWEPWSPCSSSCGRGYKERYRKCVKAPPSDFVCEKKDNITYQKFICTNWNPFLQYECPRPCDKNNNLYQNISELRHCPDQAICFDLSTSRGPMIRCKCVMGFVLNDNDWMCEVPPPPEHTTRPIPTMDTVEKTVSIVVSRTSSIVLIFMIISTLLFFIILSVFSVDRVIQMNTEISLLLAHLLLLFPSTTPQDNPKLCKTISILLHFFFTANFMFMFLESLHMYSMVAYVVPKNGLLNRLQNMIVGWGFAAIILMLSICFFFEDYGAEYHCWLRMDSNLVYMQYGPIVTITVFNFMMLEAAGAANYSPLPDVDSHQLFSSKVQQRTTLVLLPLTLASWITGVLSEHEQKLGLYSINSTITLFLGPCIFLFHSFGNQEVRARLKRCFTCCCGPKDDPYPKVM